MKYKIRYTPSSSTGFTLIELSIALVIISLLAGGIVAGQSLSHNAELRSFTRELIQYREAALLFKDKYSYYPGDFPTAYTQWSSVLSCTNADVNSTPAGCNGNGNEQVDDFGEVFRSWQHLNMAAMLPGNYTGVPDATSSIIQDVTPGLNVPSAATAHHISYYIYYHLGTFGVAGNTITMVAPSTSTEWAGALTPADAYMIDNKIDDGLASKGLLFALRGNNYSGSSTSCVDAAYSSSSANYLLNDTATSCRIHYYLDQK